MKKIDALKYLTVLSLPVTAAISFTTSGWLTFLPVIYAFGAIPLLELFFKPQPENINEAERELRKQDRWYDYMLYLIVPVQYGFLIWFLFAVSEPGLSTVDLVGRITGMGMLCGVLGINVAHELGHRPKKNEQNMAKALLLTSLYTHFFIEHNRGHHRNVSTLEDPSSARFNEWLPLFWIRSVATGYISAWRLEAQRLKRKGDDVVSLKNEMIRFTAYHILLLVAITVFFGWMTMLYFALAAIMGFLLLETVNYIEHYGLSRKKVSANRYENTMPWHSWNSDHVVGRLLLFELSRHSDHHYRAAKKYQLLDHHENSPQMPTGYPGMMLLAAIPPLWFTIMNKRVRYWRTRSESLA